MCALPLCVCASLMYCFYTVFMNMYLRGFRPVNDAETKGILKWYSISETILWIINS